MRLVISIRWFFYGVYLVALIETDGTGEKVEETPSILS